MRDFISNRLHPELGVISPVENWSYDGIFVSYRDHAGDGIYLTTEDRWLSYPIVKKFKTSGVRRADSGDVLFEVFAIIFLNIALAGALITFAPPAPVTYLVIALASFICGWALRGRLRGSFSSLLLVMRTGHR